MTAGSPATSDTPLSQDRAMTDLLRAHFWCDFSDIIPALAWDDTDIKN